MPDELTLKIVKAAPATPAGPALFAIVRDEDYFLPFFFDHYRKLGIEFFVIYDDRSGPATVDFLMARTDCAVLRSDHTYGETVAVGPHGLPRRLSTTLKETAPETLLPGRWVLTVDADEFLVLPSGCKDLVEFIDVLERAGQLYATAPMVDLYGETLDGRNYARDLSPFAGNPYFDAGPYYYWTGYTSPVQFGGGVRARLLRMLCERHPDRIRTVYGDQGPRTVALWKAPLLKHGHGIARRGDHEINVPPRADVTAALAHFKFYPDLDAKIDRALKEKQYYAGSVDYRFLDAAIELFGRESLIDAETRRFEGSESFERAGLLTALEQTRKHALR